LKVIHLEKLWRNSNTTIVFTNIICEEICSCNCHKLWYWGWTFGILHRKCLFHCFGKVKKSKAIPRNRPRRPIGLWDVKDLTLSRQSAHRWW
jgi:hypothetical protein